MHDVTTPVPRAAGVSGIAVWLLIGSLALAGTTPLAAQDTGEDEEIARLRDELAALKDEYAARIAELERRLARLEASTAPSPSPAEPSPAADELARLRAAAEEAARQAAAAAGPAPAPAQGPALGRERNLNRFNPEVSVTGIFLGQAADGAREEFRAQEFELDLQSALDPYSRARLTVALGDEGVPEVEEGWVSYSALPGGLQLLAGKFRQRFGPLNRQHLHALPQVDYPLVFQQFFGEEGLAQTGLSLDWTLPHPWASANELTLEITDGENEIFGGENFERLAVLGHAKSFWDLSPAAWLEWGLSGVWGGAPGGGSNRVLGTDLTFHWQPPSRAKYRELTWRTEVLLSRRADGLAPGGGGQDAWGGYSYLEALVAQNLYAGLRLDRVEDPLDPSLRLWGVSPYLTFWQSEFVRLRGELRHLSGDLGDFPENQLFLQLTWAAGPHKHDTY